MIIWKNIPPQLYYIWLWVYNTDLRHSDIKFTSITLNSILKKSSSNIAWKTEFRPWCWEVGARPRCWEIEIGPLDVPRVGGVVGIVWLRKTFKNCVSLLVSKSRSQKQINAFVSEQQSPPVSTYVFCIGFVFVLRLYLSFCICACFRL